MADPNDEPVPEFGGLSLVLEFELTQGPPVDDRGERREEFTSDAVRRAAWVEHRDRILRMYEWDQRRDRPWAWFVYEAGRDDLADSILRPEHYGGDLAAEAARERFLVERGEIPGRRMPPPDLGFDESDN